MLDWLGKDLIGVGVWSLEHESKQKSYQRSLRLEDVVPGILDEIVNKQLGKRPFALIGHSYGGLIIKELLRESKSHDAFSFIHQACRYVCFLATPHLGSGWANFVKAIADPLLSQTSEDLETKNLHNSRLHQWFSSWIGERKMQDAVHSFIEYQDSGIVVVSRDSAYAGVGATKQTTLDHNGIAKPKDRDSDPYKTIRSKLDSLLGELSPVSEVPLAAHRSHPNQAGTKTEATIQKHDHTLVIAVVPSLHQMALEQEGERYMLRHWLFHGDDLKILDTGKQERRPCLDACASGVVPLGDIKKYLAKLISYADNDLLSEVGTRLFVRILLPASLFADDSLRLHPSEDENIPCPVFLGCSSRYRVGGSDLPPIWTKSRRALDEKCKSIEVKLGSLNSNLGCLDWGFFSTKRNDTSALFKPANPTLQLLDSLDLDDPSEDQVDRLASKEAIFLPSIGGFLQASSAAESNEISSVQRWHRLFKAGVPFALFPHAASPVSGSVDHNEQSDCMLAMMQWSKDLWLDRLNRYIAGINLSEAELSEIHVRKFIRGFHFIYEDLRYAPDRVKSRLGVSSSIPPTT
jgi:pimeloyl-ACP methyl ester carboxylesterase